VIVKQNFYERSTNHYSGDEWQMLWQTRCDMLQQDKANLESTVSMLRQQLKTIYDQSARADAEWGYRATGITD